MTTLDVSKFQPARLIPTTGINGAIEQERRTASSLLAVMQGVPELTLSLLREHGAFNGHVETFIEPEFKVNGKKIRPDGLIQISKGKRVWRTLVEFKTGKNDLELTQINNYLDIAKQEGIDALVTISNQVLDATFSHPTPGIDQRRLRTTKLIHLSWLKIITECIILSEHTGVEDSERDWILKELIRFLQADASGASEFNDMGPNWTSVRDNIKNGSIKKPDESVIDVVTKFQNLIRYCAMSISAKSGVNASEVVDASAKRDGKKFLQAEATKLLSEKSIKGIIRIPGAASDLHILADLSAGVTHCYFNISAPSEGRNKAKVNWLLRQYKNVPKGAKLSIWYKRSRTQESAVDLNELKAGNIELEIDNSREIASFRIDVVQNSGTKRGRGQGAFIDSVLEQVEFTYRQALQPLKVWVAAAPKLSENVRELLPEIDPDKEPMNF
jgi:hypothetical protein